MDDMQQTFISKDKHGQRGRSQIASGKQESFKGRGTKSRSSTSTLFRSSSGKFTV